MQHFHKFKLISIMWEIGIDAPIVIQGNERTRSQIYKGYEQVDKEMSEMGENFEAMFENVNYHLKEATKEFGTYSSWNLLLNY